MGFAAGAFEAADGFLVAADLGGDGFEAAAQLVDLDGQAGQGAGILTAGAVLLDDSAQVGPPVKGGPADPGAGGYFAERDRLPGLRMLPGVVDGLGPGGEQPVQLRQVPDPGGAVLGQLGQELAPDCPEKSFDLPPAFWLTGQSKIILWITWLAGWLAGAC